MSHSVLIYWGKTGLATLIHWRGSYTLFRSKFLLYQTVNIIFIPGFFIFSNLSNHWQG